MINQNIRLGQDENGYFIRFPKSDNAELAELRDNNDGNVYVKVSKPMASKTMRQLSAFHPLALAFYLTGMHSAPEAFRQSFSLFRYWLKMEFGPAVWVEYQGSHIPICKSIADYTVEEMSKLIEGLIYLINESGAYAESAEIQNILSGMQKEA